MNISDLLETPRGRAQLLGGAAGVVLLIALAVLLFGGSDGSSDVAAVDTTSSTMTTEAGTTTTSATGAVSDTSSTTVSTGSNDSSTRPTGPVDPATTTIVPYSGPIACEVLTASEFESVAGSTPSLAPVRRGASSLCVYSKPDAGDGSVSGGAEFGILEVMSAEESNSKIASRLNYPGANEHWQKLAGVGDVAIADESQSQIWATNGKYGYNFTPGSSRRKYSITELTGLLEAGFSK